MHDQGKHKHRPCWPALQRPCRPQGGVLTVIVPQSGHSLKTGTIPYSTPDPIRPATWGPGHEAGNFIKHVAFTHACTNVTLVGCFEAAAIC